MVELAGGAVMELTLPGEGTKRRLSAMSGFPDANELITV